MTRGDDSSETQPRRPATELESFEVWSGLPGPAVDSHPGARADGLDPAALFGGAAPAAPAAPARPNPAPRVPMRALFWSKIDAAAASATVWRNLSDEGLDVDVDALERDFRKERAARRASEAPSGDGAAAGKRVGLVDARTAQNVAIALAKLRVAPAAVRAAVLACDFEVLPPHKMELVLGAAPSAEDAAACAEFRGDESRLEPCEAFFRALGAVPDLRARLEGLVLAHRFDAAAEALDGRLRAVTVACEEVSRSEALARWLERVLRLGNYLNGGTRRGGALGFRLDALPKLAQVKSSADRADATLLHHLAAWGGPGDVARLAADLPGLEPAGRAGLESWDGDLADLAARVAALGGQLAARAADPAPGCALVESLGPFRDRAARALDDLRRRRAATDGRFAALSASFGDDAAARGPAAFFGDVRALVDGLAAAARDNAARDRDAERRRRRERAGDGRAAARRASGRARDAVGDALDSLKAATAAEDVLAKLQGPRRRRGDGRGAAAPRTSRMSDFIRRAAAAPPRDAAAPPPAAAPLAAAPPPAAAPPAAAPPAPPPAAAAFDGQAELAALASLRGPRSPKKGGELFAKLAAKRGKKKRPPPPRP